MDDAEVMVVFDQIAEKIISAIETNKAGAYRQGSRQAGERNADRVVQRGLNA
jgi:hypothetical protein